MRLEKRSGDTELRAAMKWVGKTRPDDLQGKGAPGMLSAFGAQPAGT